ncbi:hypothetical protein BAUCODRAFT_508526 [Baudoinia panamericana UAMH 10762]|uniref:DUF1907 domain-containing protein n=1 Tax=Baudoinia panamericana (strain UAMH 10762) TaxID=717646 RepID=M2MWI9_BAUPA|nr:uncharacterized protein BAUCODRAFT_508526 [Baudoinia panamericana UAMH 10762]EMC95913.1 hypothetical protein BAUCODRAFT_508526 [Baudoinia panamericana UAMH 10762]
MQTTRHLLSPPSLDELAQALHPALTANYEDASISVVDSPDLREAPYRLAARGLSGNECVADIGGQPHLFPRPRLEKKYSMLECAQCMEMSKDRGLLIGAGAGPFHVLGKNSELAPNLSWTDGFSKLENKTHFAMTGEHNTDVVCEPSPSTDCALMMNLYGSSGNAGPVLKVTARARKGEQKSFTECIRQALHQVYGDERQITLGGVFVIKRGKALFHVMPDFPPESELPWKEREQLNSWLTFHEFGSPMVCLTIFHSADPEKLGLRMEHTHAFSSDGKSEGGHYHFDLPVGDDGAEEIEYEAYFNTAKVLYRLDQPEVRPQQDLHN